MNARRVFLPAVIRSELRNIGPVLRLYVENHLENVAQIVATTPVHRLELLFDLEDDSLVTEVQGIRIHFIVDSSVLWVQKLQRVRASARRTPGASPLR